MGDRDLGYIYAWSILWCMLLGGLVSNGIVLAMICLPLGSFTQWVLVAYERSRAKK